MEINCLKLHDTLKINPKIGNYQNYKNPSQAFHEDEKKSLKKVKKFGEAKKREQATWTCGFLFLFPEEGL